MAGRVLSTESGKTSIVKMSQIIKGGLSDQIAALDREGKNLSTPEIWDGNLATQFRSQIWPDTHKALNDAKVALEELRSKLDVINRNIMTAGGNS